MIDLMKNRLIILSALLIIFLAGSLNIQAQRNEWVNQVIVANGGIYEAPPYTDFVTVQSYNPVSKTVNVFGTIYTQSVQDVVINGNVAYVAAEDSIVMYNIDTYQRIAAIADSGVGIMYFNQNRLIVTKQYPVKHFFVEILDGSNLALLGFVQGLSGECGGAIMSQDLLYVAIDSGWQGTRGKLAIINPAANWQLLNEVDLGTDAIGIWNLYNYNGYICAVNKTPYGALNQGSITMYDVNSGTFQNYVFNVRIGDGYGIKDNLLYVNINDGMGSINLDTHQIADTNIIPPPSSTGAVVIHAGTLDYINNEFYLNIGNFSNFGIGVIAALNGDSIGSYATGINAECIAIDYRTPASVPNDQLSQNSITISPNPVTDILTLNYSGNTEASEVKIIDLTGKIVYSQNVTGKVRNFRINCSGLTSGIYLLSVNTGREVVSRKFIIK